MSSRRMRWLLIIGLLVVSLIFILICYTSFSMLGRQSQKLVEEKLKNHTAETQLAKLPEVKKQVDQYGFFNSVAKTVLPSDKDQAQAVLDIYQMANQSGFAIQDLTFPSSTLGSSTATPSSGTSATTTPTKSVISQATPVPGISGLYSIPLTISPQIGVGVPAEKRVTYAKMLDFLQHIEKNRRTAQITKVNVTPAANGDFSFIITVNLFIKP